jgi:hypothetical protein
MIRQRFLRFTLALLLVSPLASPNSAVEAQWVPEMVLTDSAAAPTPFGPGEFLVYRVKLGWFNVGFGHLSMEGLELVGDRLTYRATMGINGRAVVSLDDSYTTWFDVETLQSWRFTRDMNQGNYSGTRDYVFDPDRMMWKRQDNDEFGPLSSPLPFDEIAFMYLIRTLPLEVGDTYTFDRYFKENGNPVTLEVLRRDTRETDAGDFNTIVVRPSFQDEGLFSESGEAELHFTDDDRRLLVYMWVNMPNFPGGISLHLQSITEGFPVNPESRARALIALEQRETASR